MKGPRAVRPEVGSEANVVLLGRAEIDLVPARVLFDRGRGLILEALSRPVGRLERGRPVLLVYAAGEGVFHWRGVVSEVLTRTRFYMLPGGEPREMEKREYIRAVVSLPAALELLEQESAPAPLKPVRVELSASGFRWFEPNEATEGSKVRLVLGPPIGRSLPAVIVRVTDGAGGPEWAGNFLSPSREEREALLRLVFRTRLSELGVQDVESW